VNALAGLIQARDVIVLVPKQDGQFQLKNSSLQKRICPKIYLLLFSISSEKGPTIQWFHL